MAFTFYQEFRRIFWLALWKDNQDDFFDDLMTAINDAGENSEALKNVLADYNGDLGFTSGQRQDLQDYLNDRSDKASDFKDACVTYKGEIRAFDGTPPDIQSC